MDASVFQKFQLNGLELQNRLIKSATYEGLSKDGLITQALIDWHVALIKGGVGMTTLAYCSVNSEGATFRDQIVVGERAFEGLKSFTKAVHEAGGRASIQLSHCGFFSKNTKLKGKPVSPVKSFNNLGLFSGIPFSRAMTEEDIDRTLTDFGNAALTAKEAGFDAIELHSGHGYLLSQFLSPIYNKRNDDYGGSIESRLKFPVEVIQKIRLSVGDQFPLLVKMNLDDGVKGGLKLKESRHIATTYEKAGASALVLSGGFTNSSPFYLLRGDIPLKRMIAVERNWLQKIGVAIFGPMIIKKLPFEELFFMSMAKEIRKVVNLPLVYVGGVTSLANMEAVLKEGFDLISLGRPLIYDPVFVNRLKSGEVEKTGCTYCNQCVPEIDSDGIWCVLQAKAS